MTVGEIPQEKTLSKIQENPQNPRKFFDEIGIQELADNIKEVGLLQPIRIRPVDDGYQIVHGHRRYRAIKMLERETILATASTIPDQKAFEISLSENILRADLSAIEEAEGFQRLIDEFDYTQQQVAERFGKSQPFIANRLVLLKLPESISRKNITRVINQSHGELLAKIDDPELQIKLADEVEQDGLSVRELERRIKDSTPEQSIEQPKTEEPEPSTQDATGESGEQAEPSESGEQESAEQPQAAEAEVTSDEQTEAPVETEEMADTEPQTEQSDEVEQEVSVEIKESPETETGPQNDDTIDNEEDYADEKVDANLPASFWTNWNGLMANYQTLAETCECKEIAQEFLNTPDVKKNIANLRGFLETISSWMKNLSSSDW